MSKLTDEINKYAARNPVRFHVPGHKGLFNPLDVTELFFTDNLYIPDETLSLILNLEERISRVFFPHDTGDIKSTVSCGGATLGIQSALLAAIRKSQKITQPQYIICTRNCHISFVNTLALLDIEPVWVYENNFDNFDNFNTVLAQNTDKNIVAAFVTSPDYYGNMCNVREISRSCKQYDIPLIVDNAHGSHLAFYQNGALHAKNNGADIVIDSVHKTLPSLTGAAVVHADINYDIRGAMRIFASTSPSYLILQSVEAMLDFLETDGRTEHCRLLEDITKFLPGRSPTADPFRIILECENSGEKLYHFLHENNITCEFYEKDRVILIPSVFNKSSDFEALAEALTVGADIIRQPSSINPTSIISAVSGRILSAPTTKRGLSLGEAIKRPCEIVAVNAANGRICAEPIFAYPPGIPVILPGEIINAEISAAVAGLRDKICVVSGMI